MLAFDSNHIMLSVVKRTKDGLTALRLYESAGHADTVTVEVPDIQAAWSSSLLEEPREPLAIIDQKLSLSFAPYEIKTVLLSLQA